MENSRIRKHRASLERRHERLQERLDGPWAGSPAGLVATNRECAAIAWAIAITDILSDDGVLSMYDERARAVRHDG